ncbi:dexh-box atp-dependent rna helicase dexh18 [Quercus suber]|uniref:RNA helicase n=1 Tax=Quercus suber TaxID=58331 RepID=A0AAW0KLV9_QUESU
MSLFRIYKLKAYPSSSTRLRVLLSNHSFYGLLFDPLISQHYWFCPTALDVPNRPFSTSAFTLFHLLAPCKFPSQPLKFKVSATLHAKPFSSLSAPNGDDDHGMSSLTMVESESECDFDADVGLLHSLNDEGCSTDGDSTMVELGNGVNEEGIVVDSMVASDNNDDVGLERCEGHLNVASRDPVEVYRELRNAVKCAKQTRCDWEIMQEVFSYFGKSGWTSNQALAIYIGMSFFPTAVQKFRNFFFKKCSTNVFKYVVSLGPSDDAIKFLFPIFMEYCLEEFPDEIKRFQGMIESADLTKPHTWFPFARAMKRKIIYHCGPTNSGKTYNALQRFMEAKKGIYCSPLRLLAMEVFDKVNAHGVYCSLLTGQEKKYVPFSNHIACTVEMVSTDELYDVAVIDEIQVMADPCRGYAWTRALLGLKADEIHLCGDPSVLSIVRKICAETGDQLHEQHYDRFKPLVVEAKTLLGDLKKIRSGDCVVAFSRREIFEVKMAIEKHTNHRCCVIYGALPPETRRQQATLFNDQDNEFDVLVASDAVGMGLNLNIRRVIFYSLSKYNGDKIVPVPASQVKQIAGRAGRRGSRYPDGLTTTLHLEDLDYLIEFNIRDPKAMYHLLRFASAYSQNVPVNIAMGMPKGSARNDSELLDLETKHQVLSMYMWLSNHFKEETFPYVKKAEAMATDIADLLGQSLTKANWKPESRQAGKPKPQRKEDGYERPRSLIKLYEK